MNSFLFGLQSVTEIFRKIIFFPLWWVTAGLVWYAQNCWKFFYGWVEISGFLVWTKNIFKPMYGQNDLAGILISLIIRLAQIFFRGIFLLFWLIIAIFLFLLWFIVPLFAIYQVLFQIFPEIIISSDIMLNLFK